MPKVTVDGSRIARAILAWGLIASIATNALALTSRRTGEFVKPIDDETVACIIKQDPKLIEAWFRTLPGSPAETRVVSRREARFVHCTGTNLAQMLDWRPEYDYPALRAAITHFLVRKRIIAVPSQPPVGLSAQQWYGNGADVAASRDEIIANDLGFCLAKSNWPLVRTLVLSDRESAPESIALHSLVPLIGGCIPPGAKLRIDKARLRAILEQTTYHAVGGVLAPALASFAYEPGKRD